MAVLDHLEPRALLHHFEEICAIPHGSGNTEAISAWCVQFAKNLGLECRRDHANNVVIFCPATTGYEAAPTLILQAHIDMVCEKNPDCPKDMQTEGLDLVVDGDRIYAKGTTLGADDGLGLAAALTILEDPTIAHPRLEVVLTADEEVGMGGAQELDMSDLQGRQMISLDSESERVFKVGCAGGSQVACFLPVTRAAFAGQTLHVSVSGLVGGHSGGAIHLGQANANILMGRLLYAGMEKTPLRLCSVNGGLKDNAIPFFADAVVTVEDAKAFCAAAEALAQSLKREYRTTDPDFTMEIRSCDAAERAMDEASTRRVLGFLRCIPNGVQAMSQDIKGLVQTSLNLGILKTEEDHVLATTRIRSSLGSQTTALETTLVCLSEVFGGRTEISGAYPAWEYRENSPLRERMRRVFVEQYGHEPEIRATHSGLECGTFCGKIPGLDCVSTSAELDGIHTPSEQMYISSVQRWWTFIREVLRQSR